MLTSDDFLKRLWPPMLLLIASSLAVANLTPISSSTSIAEAGNYLTVSTDKSQYFPLETVNIWGSAVTPGVTWTYTCTGASPCGLNVRIRIYGPNGTLIHEATTDPNLAGYKSFFYAWQIPCISGILSASYKIEASTELFDGEIKGQTSIFISLPLGAVMEALAVTTDKPRYAPGETVYIKGLFQSGAMSITGGGTALVDIGINVTQPPYPPYQTVFETRLSNLTATVFSSANCPMVDYPLGEDFPLSSVHFSVRFRLPQDAGGAYAVHAAVTGFRNSQGQIGISGGDGESFFTVGTWNYTATILQMVTTQSMISFLTTESSSAVVTQGQATVVLTSLVTTSVAEFPEAPLIILVAIAVVAVLIRKPSYPQK